MKDTILIISVLVAVALLLGVVQLAQKADKASKSLQEERYSRMVAEETLQKNEAKLVTFQQELRDANDKMAQIQDAMNQEKTTNLDLKKKYDALSQAKTVLEAKLQAALQVKATAAQAAQAVAGQAQPPAPAAVQPTAASTGH
ncbi:MAG: hypothetical protein KGJ61_02305 [Candidatus Omnitrophica bacterium]|nr:hypothetical protein [Candidatus Omnitrophota bacterium]